MAFNKNSNNGSNAATGNNDSWKAQGFLNLYLPSKDGGRRKLGAIALHDNKKSEKQLMDWLCSAVTESGVGTEERVALILSSLQMEFRLAESSDASGFALG